MVLPSCCDRFELYTSDFYPLLRRFHIIQKPPIPQQIVLLGFLTIKSLLLWLMHRKALTYEVRKVPYVPLRWGL